MACLWIILRDESQTVGNSPLLSSSPTINPTERNATFILVTEFYNHSKKTENIKINKFFQFYENCVWINERLEQFIITVKIIMRLFDEFKPKIILNCYSTFPLVLFALCGYLFAFVYKYNF